MTDRQEKKAAILAFTKEGERLAGKIIFYFEEKGYRCMTYQKTRDVLAVWVKEQFFQAQVLVFVGAAGIAVRAVAPWVKDKFTDPAVVVIDEMGKFVIPLLSGHLGGANDFARMLAGFLHAVPVITTATDLQGCFAVDVFARDKGLWIADRKLAKEMSAAVLRGSPVGVFFDGKQTQDFFKEDFLNGSFTKGEKRWNYNLEKPGEINLYFGIWKKEKWDERIPKDRTLQLVPKVLTLGVGCRRGIAYKDLKEQVMEGLDAWGILPQAVKNLATITLKKDEKAIHELCQEMHWELCFFSPRELSEAEGEFSYSAFVEEKTGVGNVCERAAVLGAKAPLLQKKTVKKGVTLAASRMEHIFL